VRHDLIGLPLFDVILGHLDALVPEEFLRGERVVDVSRNLAAYVVLMEAFVASGDERFHEHHKLVEFDLNAAVHFRYCEANLRRRRG